MFDIIVTVRYNNVKHSFGGFSMDIKEELFREDYLFTREDILKSLEKLDDNTLDMVSAQIKAICNQKGISN